MDQKITLDFIQTRIREQEEYIEKLMATPMSACRKIEVLDSAKWVLKYWNQKEHEHKIRQKLNGKSCSLERNPIYPNHTANFYEKQYLDNEITTQNAYRDQLASILPPSEEFESMAEKITQPFSLHQAIHY